MTIRKLFVIIPQEIYGGAFLKVNFRALTLTLIAIIFLISFPHPSFSQTSGKLTVIVPLRECEIVIDSVSLSPAKNKTLTMKLSPGSHTLIVRLNEGTPIFRRTVELEAGQTVLVNVVKELKHKRNGQVVPQVQAAAAPAAAVSENGSLTVITPLPDCSVIIDSTKLEPSANKIFSASYAPGYHTLMVRLSNGTPIFRDDTVELVSGSSRTINVVDELKNKRSRQFKYVREITEPMAQASVPATSTTVADSNAAMEIVSEHKAENVPSSRWGISLGVDTNSMSTSKQQYPIGVSDNFYLLENSQDVGGQANLSLFYDSMINDMFSWEVALDIYRTRSLYDQKIEQRTTTPPFLYDYKSAAFIVAYPLMLNLKMKLNDWLTFGLGPNFTAWAFGAKGFDDFKVASKMGGQAFFDIEPWGTEIGVIAKNGELVTFENVQITLSGAYIKQKFYF